MQNQFINNFGVPISFTGTIKNNYNNNRNIGQNVSYIGIIGNIGQVTLNMPKQQRLDS